MAERYRNPPKIQPLSLKDFAEKRNKILIWHDKGGLGDVLMQRMMMEDFREIFPDGEFIFACLPEYIDAAKDCPFFSKVIDSRTVDPKDYINYYNTCVTIADRIENHLSPNCKDHRSDIWANYCGVKLKHHEMHFKLHPDIIEQGKAKVNSLKKDNQPSVIFVPISKMVNKTLLDWQTEVIIDELKGCSIIGLNKGDIPILTKLGIPGLYKQSLEEWISYVNAADYVISVDTAAFHLAGGLKKPLMGIFTFADGKVYGKYFDFVLVQKHRDNGNWDCGPCFKFVNCPKCKTYPKPCLTELTEQELRQGVKEMFRRWPKLEKI